MTSGFKLTRTTFLRKVDLDHLYSKYYAYKIQILHDLLLQGAKTIEVPVIFSERVRGSSKIEQKDLFDSFYVVVRLRLRDSKKFVKFLMVGGFGFILNAVILRLLVDGAGWHPAASNLVGAAAAIFSNYNFNNLWTFKESRAKTFAQYILKMLQFYLTSSIGVILIQTGTIFLGTHLFGQEHYFQFFILGTFFLLIWNFTLYNKIIWRKK
jgi:putative flippase GtrA